MIHSQTNIGLNRPVYVGASITADPTLNSSVLTDADELDSLFSRLGIEQEKEEKDRVAKPLLEEELFRDLRVIDPYTTEGTKFDFFSLFFFSFLFSFFLLQNRHCFDRFWSQAFFRHFVRRVAVSNPPKEGC